MATCSHFWQFLRSKIIIEPANVAIFVGDLPLWYVPSFQPFSPIFYVFQQFSAQPFLLKKKPLKIAATLHKHCTCCTLTVPALGPHELWEKYFRGMTCGVLDSTYFHCVQENAVKKANVQYLIKKCSKSDIFVYLRYWARVGFGCNYSRRREDIHCPGPRPGREIL